MDVHQGFDKLSPNGSHFLRLANLRSFVLSNVERRRSQGTFTLTR